MRKLVYLLLFIPLFYSCATTDLGNNNTSEPVNNYYNEAGEYYYKTYDIYCTLTKVNVLNEFGITQSEWNNAFGDHQLWRGFTSGSTRVKASDVESKMYKTIRNTALRNYYYYYAILNPKVESERVVNSYGAGYKYAVKCYAIYFNDENYIYVLRDHFKNIHVYDTSEAVQ